MFHWFLQVCFLILILLSPNCPIWESLNSVIFWANVHFIVQVITLHAIECNFTDRFRRTIFWTILIVREVVFVASLVSHQRKFWDLSRLPSFKNYLEHWLLLLLLKSIFNTFLYKMNLPPLLSTNVLTMIFCLFQQIERKGKRERYICTQFSRKLGQCCCYLCGRGGKTKC